MEQQRTAKPKEILSIFPLCNMTRDEYKLFCQMVPVKAAKRGKVLLEIGQKDNKTLFLVHGSIDLEDADGNTYTVTENSAEALRPISYKNPHTSKVIARTAVEYLRVDNKVIYHLLEKKSIVQQLTQGENHLLEKIASDLSKDKLVLPANPKVAQSLQSCLAKDVKIATLEKLVAADPALASNLIKAANSVLFRCASGPVNSIQRAIIRMGLSTVAFLIQSYLVRQLYVGAAGFQQRVEKLWQHSADVAATAYVLAEKLALFDPDSASLAGLLHNIGSLPIIAYAEANTDLYQGEQELDQAIEKYHSLLGERMLQQWQFDREMIEVVKHIDNWQYQHSGAANLCDLILVANYHVHIINRSAISLPPLVNLPCFAKLGLNKDEVDSGIEMLHAAQKQIGEIRALFVL